MYPLSFYFSFLYTENFSIQLYRGSFELHVLTFQLKFWLKGLAQKLTPHIQKNSKTANDLESDS